MRVALRLCVLRSYAPGFLLADLACAHPWLERTMARHMGLELPALLILGWLAAAHADDWLSRVLAGWNANGLPGLLFALCATGFWMVPAALDQAVLRDGITVAKIASLVAAGLLARASWSSSGMVVQGFFVLNWSWMTLAAGLLYQEAPQQLCSATWSISKPRPAGRWWSGRWPVWAHGWCASH